MSLNVSITPTLTLSQFRSFGMSDTLVQSQMEIRTTGGVLLWEGEKSDGSLTFVCDIALDHDTPYIARARHRGAILGWSDWQEREFTTRENFPLGAGPDGMLSYDPMTDTGYFGTVAASELFTGSELASAVSLGAGTAFNNDVPWLKFYVGPDAIGNKEGGIPYAIFVPQRPHRYNLSWDQINAAGVARGDVKTVSKSGHTYKVRLLSGGNNRKVESGYPGTGYHHPGGPMESEWNQLIYRVHSMVPNGTEFASGGPQVGDNWANFTDAELGVNYQVSPNGNASWCTEDWFENSSHRVSRGYHSVAGVGAHTSSNVYTRLGWRSALVAVPD